MMLSDATLKRMVDALIERDYRLTGDRVKYEFDKLDIPLRAIRSLKQLLGCDARFLIDCLGVVKPCLYEAHGESPDAAVEFHQLPELGKVSEIGWAIACYRGEPGFLPRFWGSWCDGVVIVSRDLQRVIGVHVVPLHLR